jgi:hypothetical protein
LISRDEGVHCDYRALAQPPLGKQSAKDRIREIIVDALNIEESLSRSRGFFNRNERRIDDTVLRFVADRLLVELGCDRN